MHPVCSSVPPDPSDRCSYLQALTIAEPQRQIESTRHRSPASAWATILAMPNTVQNPAETLPRSPCYKNKNGGHRESPGLQLAQASPSFRRLDQASYSLLSYGITARGDTSGST